MMEPKGLAKVLILTAFFAWSISLIAIPLVKWLAHRVGLVDRPDPTRKLHRGDIALGGGLAIFITCIAAVLLIDRYVLKAMVDASLQLDSKWLALAVSSAGMVLLGLIDDRFELRGKQKLAGQAIIAMFLALAWKPDGNILLFGWTIDLGTLALPLLVVWLLAAINAVNLIDGADGVAGSFSSVAAVGIALVACLNGNVTVAIVSTAIAFATAGFLCFNRPPASIFLGDAGSMLLGLVLGTLACWSVQRPSSPAQDILIPMTLIGVPLFDSVAAVLRRVLTGRSIYVGDRGHLHHIIGSQLKARQLSPMWMLVAFGGLTAVTSAGAIVGTVFRSDYVALLAIASVVGGLVWSRIFGHAEARLLASHTRRMGGSVLSRVRRAQPKTHVAAVPLQGNREWDSVWLPLVEFAEKYGLWQLKLDLNMPWQHEGYHGFWSRGRLPEKEDQWSIRLPIICQRRSVGRLEIVGQAEGESQLESLESFSYLVSEMQPAVERLVWSLDSAHAIESVKLQESTVKNEAELVTSTSSIEESGTVRFATEA